ncbi:OX-2 membrane glycoprotein-like isoform X2 [Sander vitreus]
MNFHGAGESTTDLSTRLVPDSPLKACSEAKLKVFSVQQQMKMLPLLILAGLLFQACTSQITGYGNTTADYGSSVHYRCAVANPKGVLQVTWQRLFKDESIENLASYSKRFGQQVNDPYRGKVIFTEASLSSTSITLANVTWGDESCYICSFNVYPDGSKRKQTCLTVQGISRFKTEVQAPSSEQDEEYVTVVFSCSATGKPAPTIQWDFSPTATPADQPQTATVTNSDHTFTSSSNITLQVPPNWEGNVDCLLNTGVTGQRRERIPFSLPKKEEEEGKGLSSSGIAFLITAVVFIFAIAAAMTQKRLKGSRRDESV